MVDWLVFSLFLRLKLHVAVAELLRYVTKDYCWAGRGCCRGARGPSLSPLLFRPCLPYSIFPKKKKKKKCTCTNAPLPTRALTHSLPSVFSYPEIPVPTYGGTTHVPQEQHNAGVAIGGAVGGVALLGLAAILLFIFLRRRQRTFKGDYSTKKHVFGNGYSKAGGLPTHPPIPKNLQYPDDSDEEKKPAQIGTTGGFEAGDRDFDAESDLKRPYFTVDEGESRDYDERTLAFQYEPESEIADDMISQTDGSVISKKEWYV